MLLLLPFDRELDWKRPPLAVIALVLVNCVIFFGFQWHDDEKAEAALTYYADSTLPQVEFPAYRDLLRREGRFNDLEEWESAVDFEDDGTVGYSRLSLPYALEFDPSFRQALADGRILASDSPKYTHWHEERQAYEAKLARSFTHSYSLRPALADPITLLSHMFMHGDTMHLLGNMVFLFIVGFVVEAVLGSGLFLLVYLAAGFGAAALDLVVQGDDLIYHLGASGAVSGVMGSYAALFGLRRIHFFYNVLFWFDRVKAPAILMLPLWLANEAIQLASRGDGGVNYWAHIAGLAVGGAATGALRLFTSKVDEEYMDRPEKEAEAARELEKALHLMGQLRYDEAQRLLLRLSQARPDDPDLLSHLFTVSRRDPAGETFHVTARKLLLADTTAPALREKVFADYIQAARPGPRLGAAEALALAGKLLADGAVEGAERLAVAVLKRTPDHPRLPPVLKQLARKAPPERAAAYRRALLRFSIEV